MRIVDLVMSHTEWLRIAREQSENNEGTWLFYLKQAGSALSLLYIQSIQTRAQTLTLG